ncbi:MAG: cytochrome c maturation protein CcmE [Flavobacteriales bacterium]|jgi:cytochrome c-type biogenesis protein CcmE|nr:cytochrome c maturation protein CcmE [Flavobacteriales bacterium]
MKRSHIIALVLIAVAMAAFIATLADSSTFVDLAQAKAKPGKEFKVKGYLDKSVPVEYEPIVDANLTTFTLMDDNGDRCVVRLAKAKPYDFERSESIVLTGKVNDAGEFEAHDMLMKCPSKYNEMQQVGQVGV